MSKQNIWRMFDLKTYILRNYPIKFNRFQGTWDNIEKGPYGTPLEYHDLFAIFEDAKNSFPGLSIAGIQSILKNAHGTDRLLDYGMSNQVSYHRTYKDGDLALYTCAGSKASNPHFRMRYWNKVNDFFKEENLGSNKTDAVEAFNVHLKIHKKAEITSYDLRSTPIII